MRHLQLLALLCFLSGLFGTGCASTKVKKNPGRFDHGIRYYRPKPYLLLQPTGGNSPEFVSVSLQYLPDFSEEYSIHIRAGIGKNNTKVTLDGGWNLTELNADIDSKTSENITAIADLVTAVGGVATRTGTGDAAKVKKEATEFTVRCKNVPYGFYESVLAERRDGSKQLYAWRYVGFAPFNQCPMIPGGAECNDCNSDTYYALAFQDGAMAFVPLHELAQQPPVTRGAGAPPVETDYLQRFSNAAVTVINKNTGLSLAPADVTPERQPANVISLSFQLTKDQIKLLPVEIKKKTETELEPLAQGVIGESGLKVALLVGEKL